MWNNSYCFCKKDKHDFFGHDEKMRKLILKNPKTFLLLFL